MFLSALIFNRLLDSYFLNFPLELLLFPFQAYLSCHSCQLLNEAYICSAPRTFHHLTKHLHTLVFNM